jgi:hypothetical protein
MCHRDRSSQDQIKTRAGSAQRDFMSKEAALSWPPPVEHGTPAPKRTICCSAACTGAVRPERLKILLKI